MSALAVSAAADLLAAVAQDPVLMPVTGIGPAALLPVFRAQVSDTAGRLAERGRSGRAIGTAVHGTSPGIVTSIAAGALAADGPGWRARPAGLDLVMAAAVPGAAIHAAVPAMGSTMAPVAVLAVRGGGRATSHGTTGRLDPRLPAMPRTRAGARPDRRRGAPALRGRRRPGARSARGVPAAPRRRRGA